MKKSDIFFHNRETLDQGNQIFSVGGTPSFRLNRREHSTSNVFPAGCMGSRSGEEIALTKSDETNDETTKARENESEGTQTGEKSWDPKVMRNAKGDDEEEKLEEAGEGYVWKRNPLTGEGMEEEQQRSHKRGTRKKLNKWVW